jgi:rare lipoprotein A
LKSIILSLSILSFACFSAEKKTGLATYYTVASCQREGTSGIFTANGEKFDESALTCAIRSRGFNSTWKVTNNKNGKSIIVRQNDYGPSKKATKRGVIIDLTPKGMELLGAGKAGEINVTIECLK